MPRIRGRLQAGELLEHRAGGTPAMGYGVLLVGRVLRERPTPGRLSFRLEDRVVSEAAAPAGRVGDPPFECPVGDRDDARDATVAGAIRAREDERAAVPGRPIPGPEVAQQAEQVRVVLLVGRVDRGEAPRPNARRAAEGVDLEPRVVGQDGLARERRVAERLERGVLVERGAVLRDLVVDAEVGERDELDACWSE
jgi:hypothetical protein